jgi:hypothetical protein
MAHKSTTRYDIIVAIVCGRIVNVCISILKKKEIPVKEQFLNKTIQIPLKENRTNNLKNLFSRRRLCPSKMPHRLEGRKSGQSFASTCCVSGAISGSTEMWHLHGHDCRRLKSVNHHL